MQRWGDGYVTDIEYTDGFYAAQAPQNLALTATIDALEAPHLDHGFAYCELGCGRGGTSLVLAAANPDAEFHAVDFQPAHIAYARTQARAASLANITFHERSFEDLTRSGAPALPMFDIVTMHGVWSWISSSNQQAILRFLDRHLKPGGLVYVSYNAMPCWTMMAPLQNVIRSLAPLWPGRSDNAAENAIALLGRLAEAKIIPTAFHEGVKRLTEGPHRRFLPYLAHEYLNEHWKPAYHTEVAHAFADAKLSYAGSTELLRNFVNLGVNEQQRKLLSEIPIPELRETLRDWCLDNWFRQDVFVRGAQRMTEARRISLLNGLRLTLIRPAPERIEIACPDQTTWRPDPAAYGVFIAALEKRPHGVAELLGLPGLPAGHNVTPAELVGVFVGTGLATLFKEPDPKARAACERLNRLTEAGGEISLSRSAIIAAPAIGAALKMTAGDFDLYMALKRRETPDPQGLARRFVKRCKNDGGHPIVEGQAFEDEAEAHSAVARDYARKLERLVPIWRTIGIVP